MMTAATEPDAMRRAWRNVIVLLLAQAVLGAQMSMIFIVGGLAGQMLSPNPCIATLPLSVLILGSALSARPLSGFMRRHGRQAGFLLSCGSAALGAAVSAYALAAGSFWLFTAGALLTGVYMAAQGFYRFAATDCAPPQFQSRAISWVLAGGLAAAFTGPLLVRLTADVTAIPFLATYAAIIGLNLLGPVLFAFLDIPRPPARAAGHSEGRPLAELLRVPQIAVAIICGMVSYALMNLVMTSAPLAVVGCGFGTGDAANIVSGHVLAMFAPSFFTGHLIARFGAARIVMVGLVILAGAGAVALSGVDLAHFYIAMILLGLGWNFGYIGATAMLTRAYRPEERERVQGLNDAIVFGGVFLASLSSGGLMNCLGGSAQAGWSAVNLAMLPFLVLAGGALLWLMLRPKDLAR
ncbi:Predicted arabinose efflux permease, MFS family [Paracoccus thiocyanatus]|uniref:Predicted arabinose efflux permease, MFS family n=1 Tax=Paracoccus thiocyanatus TaxID=34006 RepID=A0A1N6T378_9RHOB|nr:MFS transporter [Paracoccus thiocyanatus]SIQ47789.1 Predicted arabinose efflux permease, MFS family [Paracoccus thiocyanatus]